MDGYTPGFTGLPTIPKTIDGELDYTFNWTDWLTQSAFGETIISHTVTVQTGLNLISHTASATMVVVFVDGGVNGQSYTVDCEIVTATRRESRSIVITVATRR